MDNDDLNLPKITGQTPPAPVLTMDEYLEAVEDYVLNLAPPQVLKANENVFPTGPAFHL